MADTKISALTELAQGAIANADELPVVDTDATETKRYTWLSLLTDVAAYIATLTQTLTNKTLTSPKINEDVAVTSTATELNILDGATLSTTELNYVDGVTSAIQTQLDGKLGDSGDTLNGAYPLAENASIDLDPALSADGKYSGICITGTAGATLAFGDVIYLAAADSRWELADADSATTSQRLIGMCVLAAASDGSATKILLQGNIRADTAFPALTIGSPVYLGETAGDVQTAIPTGADNVIRVLGYALTADSFVFNPSPTSQVTVA